MTTSQRDTVTRLLGSVGDGDQAAAAELFPLVYDQLRALAGACFRAERAGHTLQPTALVHEVFIRLVDQTSVTIDGRARFFALAATAMRNILVDHARTKGRLKRGGRNRPLPIEAAEQTPVLDNTVDLVALDEALTQLHALDERKARLVELRFFAGLTAEQAADMLGISRTTVSEEWRMARAWLGRRLSGEDQ